MTGLFCGDFFVVVPASHFENRMTVCMGYPAMTLRRRAGKRRRKGGRKAMQGERQDVDFPVAEKNDVLKMITSFFRNAKKGRCAYE